MQVKLELEWVCKVMGKVELLGGNAELIMELLWVIGLVQVFYNSDPSSVAYIHSWIVMVSS